jgi:serine/threonine protein kinase
MSTQRKDREYAPGERIPGTEYIVIRLEARGGHGALYLVRHHFLEKKIQMLKTLRALEPNPDLTARLKREAQMLAGMQHPNIVSVVSGGITDEPDPRPYFVMERLRGYSLASILPNAPQGVGIDVALQILIEMCDALHYIHDRDVIHRDVKPDNIFLERVLPTGSNTKLVDFGVLHVLSAEKRPTLERMFIGTFRYAAPELLFGDRPTPQTDIYALGLVGYEIITGRHPFEGCSTIEQLAKAHINQEPPPFPKLPYPEGLELLILAMLGKKPAERPISAEWLAVQFRQIRRHADVRAGGFVLGDLNQTSPSPVQNALTMTRAEATDPGDALEAASKAVDSSATRQVKGTVTVQDRVPVLDRTLEDAPVGFVSTKVSPDPFALTSPSRRPQGMEVTTDEPVAKVANEEPAAKVPSVVPVAASAAEVPASGSTSPAPPPIDRAAPTRSPEPLAAPFKRSDTEKLPVAAQASPPAAEVVSSKDSEPEVELPISGVRRGVREHAIPSRPPPPPPTSTSSAVALGRASVPVAARGWAEFKWAIVAGAATAIALVAVYAHFAIRPSRAAASVTEASVSSTAVAAQAAAPAVIATLAAASALPVRSASPSPALAPPASAAAPASRSRATTPPQKDDIVREIEPPASSGTQGASPSAPALPRKLPGSGI